MEEEQSEVEITHVRECVWRPVDCRLLLTVPLVVAGLVALLAERG